MPEQSISLWGHVKQLFHRYFDLIPRIVDHFLGAAKEMDNVTPSSARTYGGMIFMAVLGLQVAIVWVLLYKIVSLDMALPNAPTLLPVLTKVLLVFLLWALLFDVGTALSLYGLNIWKYIAAIRCGTMPSDTSDLPSMKDVITDIKTESSQAIPPPGHVE